MTYIFLSGSIWSIKLDKIKGQRGYLCLSFGLGTQLSGIVEFWLSTDLLLPLCEF